MSQANAIALRAIEILLAFDADKPVWTADEVSARFGMSRSAAYRYLGSLLETGLLEADSVGRYRLGSRIFSLARVARKGVKILDIAAPHLRKLHSQTMETVLLSRRQGALVIVLECLESNHSARITFERGHIHPNPATASAKVLLAYAPEDEVRELLESPNLVKYTDRTMTSTETILAQLREIRERGYAVNDGEADEGIRAVAAPIHGPDDQVIYSVGIVAPSFRLTDELLTSATAVVRETASNIGRILCEQH